MRRTLIIASIVLVSLGIGIAVYYFLLPSSPETTGTPTDNPLPVAGNRTPTPGEIAAGNSGTSESPTSVSARLVKITPGPVALGEAVLDIKAAAASSSPEVAINFVEQQSGNIYSYRTREGTLTRTSNKTIPGIATAAWLPNGKTVFARYLSGTDFSTTNTYALHSDGSEGFFLPQDLAGIAVSSTSILMLASGSNGSSASLARTDGSRATTLFTTPLSALRVTFAGKNQYLAFTKPAATLAGSAYLVDSSGNFSRVAGPENGLTALASPSGKWVLVSTVSEGAMSMKLVNTATGDTTPLPVATITDKCIWTTDETTIYCGIPKNPAPGKNYPDDWYQGAVAFSDRIWKIQVSGRYAQLVLDFTAEAKTSLDAESLAINPSGTTLVFVNKNDGSLWSYQL
ncbi:MAG: hypothetical protein Q7T37_01350 [bacterium]|nr:hypothetical protein [bacterium]MDO8742279.1 hypothetical protein [bacterium]